jgi:hypothetical protein
VKCQFKKSEVKYLGHVLSSKGLKVDPEKVRAILEMPRPENLEALRRFLGMLNYLGKFLENLSDATEPLRNLLVKGVSWEWTVEHDRCFEKLKQLLCETPLLRYYDESKDLTLSVDASSKGLGATILQEGRPIAYGSRALTKSECNYSQIEKELLAIVWGCKQFYDFVAFRPVMVESDHKPLESIMKKPLYKTPLRLQNMLISLQHFDLVVTYKKGKELYIADTLSRAYLPEVDTIQVEGPLEVNLVKQQTPISSEKFEIFKEETCKDPELSVVTRVVMEGWPDQIKNCPNEAKPYFTIRSELTVVDGVLFKDAKIVVPKTLRNEMLSKIHESHQGIVRCKQRGRECLYWPGMMSQIHDLVSQCSTCKQYANYQQRQPLQNHEIPDKPWFKLGSDLFEFKGEQYCLVVDYYSKFPEIVKLGKHSTSQAVITALKSIFSRHGIPRILVSDNGPCYASAEFRKFVSDWEFVHITSSPKYPRSNGMAERYVQTIKNLLMKARDPYLAMLEYRTTPVDDIGLSPAQLLMSRRLNAKIPTHASLLKPEPVNTKTVNEKLNDKQVLQKMYYDRGTKELSPLKPGEGVRVWNPDKKIWKPAIVETTVDKPRSYIVVTKEGSKLRRNRQDIKRSPEVSFTPQLPCDQDLQLSQDYQSADQSQTTHKQQELGVLPSPVKEKGHTEQNSSEGLRKSTRDRKKPVRFKEYQM